MTNGESSATARRVICGVDADGKSAIVSDENTKTWVSRPGGSTIMDIWRLDSLPAHVDDEDLLTGEVLPPAVGGLVVRMGTFPPDSELDAAAYAAAMADTYGTQPNSGIAGMHRTDTVDVVTVVSGELYAVLETGETLLRPGDSLIQRGTIHAWSNRSDRPATVISTMVAARR